MKEARRKRGSNSRARSTRRPPTAASRTAGGTPSREEQHLSRRERQIVELLIAGRSVKEAAAALGLSPRTAEGYLERLKRRFQQPRLLALVVYLVKAGLVE
jgi:DNA-binding CsgD family transcriptional regulator